MLDFGMNIAGPEAASLLADLGADVIKVEGPGGDSSRAFQPQSDDVSTLFASMNRDKRYLGLDLTRPRHGPSWSRCCDGPTSSSRTCVLARRRISASPRRSATTSARA